MTTTAAGRALSLRRLLIAPVLTLWIASVVGVGGVAWWLIDRATNLSFDRILTDDALALGSQLRWTAGKAAFFASQETADSLVFDSLARSRYLVRTASGRRLVGDLNVGAGRGATEVATPALFDLDGPGVGGELRVVDILVMGSPADEAVHVIVAESKTARRQVSHEIALAIFVPAAVAGFLIVPLVFIGARRALAPTRRISDEVMRHGPHDLSLLPTDNVPQELQDLVQHTNELLLRLRASIDEQRRFVADAAHQLQTPVAGIRLLVGDMRRTQRADPQQPVDAEVLEQLDEVALRAARLVRQLLAFARAEDDAPVEADACDAGAVAAEVVERWRAPFAAAGKTIALLPAATASPLRLPGSPTLFGEALSNLIDNARRYGGPNVLLRVDATVTDVTLAVEDDGPRLDAATRESMLLPFWRGAHGQAEGSGLGLSIAQRIVQRMGGRLEVLTGPGDRGTAVVLNLKRT